LIDVPRLQAVDALLHGLRKRIVCLVHVNECVAAGLRGYHGIEHGIKFRRFRRLDVIRVIGVASLAGDVDPPVLEYPDWRCSGFADIRGQ
jgi:hypothetical protein